VVRLNIGPFTLSHDPNKDESEKNTTWISAEDVTLEAQSDISDILRSS